MSARTKTLDPKARRELRRYVRELAAESRELAGSQSGGEGDSGFDACDEMRANADAIERGLLSLIDAAPPKARVDAVSIARAHLAAAKRRGFRRAPLIPPIHCALQR